MDGAHADRWKAGRNEAEEIRGENRRAAGRKSRGAAILGVGRLRNNKKSGERGERTEQVLLTPDKEDEEETVLKEKPVV